MGDYNIDYLTIDEKMKFDTLLSLFDLHVSNPSTPTWQTAHSATLIDYILTDNVGDFQGFVTDPPVHTDHKMTICIQDNSMNYVKDTEKITVYSRTNYSADKFKIDLMEI